MHARTRTPVKDPQSERIFNTRVSVFIECWREHERRENRWSSAQDFRFCQLECGSPLSRAEKDEMSNTIEYLCSLADLHKQGPNTKFIACESYIRMFFMCAALEK